MTSNSEEQIAPSPRSPLAAYPLPRKSRAPEFYGFAALTGTSLLFVLYHLWALLPDELIQSAGVDWYPSREWALLIPSYTVILILLTYFSYWALAISSTPTFGDLSTIIDSYAHVPLPDQPNPYLRQADPDSVPEMYDLPIGLVNQVLFRRDRDTYLK
ncbi:PIG-P [Ramaria rubella]|nr:PIG-P [Ramaria rubella]